MEVPLPDKNDFSNKIALDLIKNNAMILDIRTKKEYCDGHIHNAILVPTSLPPLTEREINVLSDQLWWHVIKHPKCLTNHIVIYCKKGKRALIAKKILQNLGCNNVVAWGGVDEKPLSEIFRFIAKK